MCFSSCWLEPTSQFNGLQPAFLKLKKRRRNRSRKRRKRRSRRRRQETMTLGTHFTHKVKHKFTEKALGAVGGLGVWENPNFKQAKTIIASSMTTNQTPGWHQLSMSLECRGHKGDEMCFYILRKISERTPKSYSQLLLWFSRHFSTFFVQVLCALRQVSEGWGSGTSVAPHHTQLSLALPSE